jgi:hypothetical protein
MLQDVIVKSGITQVTWDERQVRTKRPQDHQPHPQDQEKPHGRLVNDLVYKRGGAIIQLLLQRSEIGSILSEGVDQEIFFPQPE